MTAARKGRAVCGHCERQVRLSEDGRAIRSAATGASYCASDLAACERLGRARVARLAREHEAEHQSRLHEAAR